VWAHPIPPGPHAPEGLSIVLFGFLGTVNLGQQLVLAAGNGLRAIELESRKVSLMAPQVDPVQPDPSRVIHTPEPQREHLGLKGSPNPLKPAAVQHEPLVRRKGVLELPVPRNTDRSPGTLYTSRLLNSRKWSGERHSLPLIE
jgi:hypothetical protein